MKKLIIAVEMKPRDIACYAIFGAVLLLLSLLHELVNPWMHYNTAAVESGEYWRIVTGHLSHLNIQHGLLNVAGFWTCCFFFSDVYKLSHFAVWSILGPVVVGLAMYFFDDPVNYYVGLSGLLYGWLMFAIIAGFRTNPGLHLVGFLVLAGRIVWEQSPIYDVNYLMDSIGGVVYVNAHLYGTLFGTTMALFVLASQFQDTTARKTSGNNG